LDGSSGIELTCTDAGMFPCHSVCRFEIRALWISAAISISSSLSRVICGVGTDEVAYDLSILTDADSGCDVDRGVLSIDPTHSVTADSIAHAERMIFLKINPITNHPHTANSYSLYHIKNRAILIPASREVTQARRLRREYIERKDDDINRNLLSRA
jgi:hypothetical protein